MSSDETSSDQSISIPSDYEVPSDFEVSATSCDVEDQSDVVDESDVTASASSSHSGTDTQKIKRKKLKKGLFRKYKGSKKSSSNQSSSGKESGDQSEDLLESVGALLSDNPIGETDASAVSESLPSDGLGTGDDEKGEEQSEQPVLSPDFKVKKKRKKAKKIGLKRKVYQLKTADEDQEEAGQADVSIAGQADVSISADPANIDQLYLAKAACTNEHLPTAAKYLQHIIDESWKVSHSSDTLFLVRMENPGNPYVERSITWTGGKVKFFVFNRPLSLLHPLHQLWDKENPDPSNWASVVDFLAGASNDFLYYEVCEGVTAHQHLWSKFSESGHGSVADHLDPPCIRSASCNLLIIYPTKCSSCKKLHKQMMEHERQKERTAARSNVDKSKTNTRYLQPKELEAKIKRINEEKRMSKQTVKRLKKRIGQLLREKAENISRGLSDDFVEIMNSNADKMTGIERMFWTQQSEALKKRGKSRTMRWHPAMIRLSLHLRMLSPAAFDFMSGILSLPSSRRLFDYSQFTDIEEGVQQSLLDELKNLIEKNCTTEYEKYFSLLLDEMSIRSDLVYNSRTGELIGFTNLTSLEEELASLEAEIAGKTYEKKLAKKVLVFMLAGCVNQILFVAAVYTTDDLSAAQLYTRAWDVIYSVEEAGAKILSVIFDGASVNRKFVRLHFNLGDKDFVYVTRNTASGESRPMYFILDPPHLLKTFRNCFANSFSHRKSRNLFKNGQNISWKAIEALYELCKNDKFKCTKLTKGHVYLTSFSCMNVLLAAQVFSRAVAVALAARKNESPLSKEYTEELVLFIEMMNRCFDCLNGGEGSKKKEDNPDLLEYSSMDDGRLKFLEEEFISYLENWEKDVQGREGDFTKEQRARMMISYQSVEGMKITICSFCAVCRFLLEKGAPSVSSRKFNQDPLEQKFSDFRRAGGDNNNPNVKQLLHSRLSMHAQGQTFSRTKRGNTESDVQMFLDDSPLQVRKKPKK